MELSRSLGFHRAPVGGIIGTRFHYSGEFSPRLPSLAHDKYVMQHPS